MIHTVGNDSKYAKFKILLNLYLVSVPWSPVGCSALCLTPFGQISGRSSGSLGSMGPIHSGPAPGSHPSAAWPAIPLVNSEPLLMASSKCRPGKEVERSRCVRWGSGRGWASRSRGAQIGSSLMANQRLWVLIDERDHTGQIQPRARHQGIPHKGSQAPVVCQGVRSLTSCGG